MIGISTHPSLFFSYSITYASIYPKSIYTVILYIIMVKKIKAKDVIIIDSNYNLFPTSTTVNGIYVYLNSIPPYKTLAGAKAGVLRLQNKYGKMAFIIKDKRKKKFAIYIKR